MRRILCLSFLLGVLLPIAGCGASADAPPPVLSEQDKQKKADEYKARMEKGMERKAEEVKKPGG
jgi:outer membrane lipoprotein-sorting protein